MYSWTFPQHEAEVYFHPFLTLELDEVEWLTSRPGRFISWAKNPGIHSRGGWGEP